MCHKTRLPVGNLRGQRGGRPSSSHWAIVHKTFMFCLLRFSLTDHSIHKKNNSILDTSCGTSWCTYIMQIVLLASCNWGLEFKSHRNAFRVFQGLVCHRCWHLVVIYISSKWHQCCFWIHFTVDFWWKMCNVQTHNRGTNSDKGWSNVTITMARNMGGQQSSHAAVWRSYSE